MNPVIKFFIFFDFNIDEIKTDTRLILWFQMKNDRFLTISKKHSYGLL